jgi:hypothetical protein
MTRINTAAAILVVIAGPAFAGASCEDIKGEIAKKLEAHQVKTFTLTVVGKDATADGKVVGSCEHGSKAIVYKRG